MKKNKYFYRGMQVFLPSCDEEIILCNCHEVEKKKEEPKSDNSWMGVVAFISIIVNVILTIILINY